MDPISCVSSLVTLLAAAGQSCTCIAGMLQDFKECSLETRRYCATLDAIRATSDRLQVLWSRHKLKLEIAPQAFLDLGNCAREIVKAEKMLSKASRRVNDGRSHSVIARASWVFSRKTRLESILAKITMWQRTFSYFMDVVSLYIFSSHKRPAYQAYLYDLGR